MLEVLSITVDDHFMHDLRPLSVKPQQVYSVEYFVIGSDDVAGLGIELECYYYQGVENFATDS